MIFQNSASTYARPVANIGIRQHLARRSAWELPGGILLWKAAGRVALVAFAVTIAVNMMFGVYRGNLATATVGVEELRHDLMDKNISLRAKRAIMLRPQQLEKAAGNLLALHSPVDGQVFIFNRDKGRFEKF
jgi:hypothetical protein